MEKQYTKVNKEKKVIAKKVPPKKITPKQTYLFWLKSNRGTDEKAIYELPYHYNESDIQGALEHWCSFYAAWEQSICSYGFKKIKVLKGAELKEKWNVVCKRMAKVREEYNTIREMFNIREFK
jgi:uncharacterized protein YecA (UPF0149 family)